MGFMDMAPGWKHLVIPDQPYVPAIGSYTDPQSGLVNEPIAKSGTCTGSVLALKAPCARGKSTVFHKFLE